MPRPPLSVRLGGELSAWEGPYDGVPPWLFGSLVAWVQRFFAKSRDLYGEVTWDSIALARMERECRLSLQWETAQAAMTSALQTGAADHEVFLNIVDWCVGQSTDPESLVLLEQMLHESSSLYTIGRDGSGMRELQRRVSAETRSAVEGAAPAGTRAAEYLARAWSHVYGRSPDASAGFLAAVKAVEAAAIPVVQPSHAAATLGTVIGEMNANPTRFECALQPPTGSAVADVVTMMKLLWKSQFDRHGSADPSVPISVSLEEAEAALHLAATLVHWFTSGAVWRR